MARARDEVPHAMGIADPVKRNLTGRLSRIRGQVEGLRRMVDEERYCPDILQQFAAVHAALRSAERTLLENHLERCATRALGHGGEAAEEVRAEILDLVFRYLK